MFSDKLRWVLEDAVKVRLRSVVASKVALLAAAKSLLPTSVLERKDKMGFPVPFTEWARGPLKGYITDTLLGKDARERGIYRPEGIAELLEGERPYGRELWGLLCLEMWFQRFIDRADGHHMARRKGVTARETEA